MEDLSGKQFGPYRVLEPCGEGGMAAVFKAYQTNMDRYVALKVLPRYFASDPQFIGRFSQEAKVLARLQHPHILPVFDFGESDGYTYFVMPFLESGDLAGLLQAKPLPLAQVVRMISQVGDALDYAHSLDIVHRDVKPSNILLDPRGNSLLTDFGIAKLVSGSTTFTRTGGIVGTPAYMSPEQIRGDKLDGRSDIYSLGIVLFEMATGRPPYRAETPPAIFVKHLHDPLPLPRRFNDQLPERIERIILKSLAKDRDNRFDSAGDMVRALQAAGASDEEAAPGFPADLAPPPKTEAALPPELLFADRPPTPPTAEPAVLAPHEQAPLPSAIVPPTPEATVPFVPTPPTAEPEAIEIPEPTVPYAPAPPGPEPPEPLAPAFEEPEIQPTFPFVPTPEALHEAEEAEVEEIPAPRPAEPIEREPEPEVPVPTETAIEPASPTAEPLRPVMDVSAPVSESVAKATPLPAITPQLQDPKAHDRPPVVTRQPRPAIAEPKPSRRFRIPIWAYGLAAVAVVAVVLLVSGVFSGDGDEPEPTPGAAAETTERATATAAPAGPTATAAGQEQPSQDDLVGAQELFDLGVGLLDDGEPAVAYDRFTKAIDLGLEDPQVYIYQGIACKEWFYQEGGCTLGEGEDAFLMALHHEPDNSWALSELAYLYHGWGQLEPALSRIDQALSLDPYNYDWKTTKAWILFDMWDLDEALIVWDQLIAQNYDDAWLWDGRGWTNERRDPFEAVHDFERAIELDPDSTDHYNGLAWAYYGTGDVDRAIEAWQAALEVNPDDAGIWLEIAYRYLEMDQPETAFDYIDRSLSLAPEWSPPHDALAWYYFHTGRIRAAIEEWDTAIELSPEDTGLLVNRSDAHAALGDVDAALQDAHAAIELEPENPDLWANRAWRHFDVGEFEASAEDWRQAIDLDYERADLHRDLARAYSNMGDEDSALEELEIARQLDPESGESLAEIARRHMDMGDFETAASYFEQAIELEPENPWIYEGYAWLYLNQGDLQESIRIISMAIAADPEEPVFYEQRAWRYMDFGQPAAAISDFDTAIELDGSNMWARIGRAEYHRRFTGNNQAALEDLLEAVDAGYYDPNSHFHLGTLYLDLGEWEQAIESLTVGIDMVDWYWPDFWAHRGYAYTQLGQRDAAREDYLAFMEMTQGDPDYEGWAQEIQYWLNANP